MICGNRWATVQVKRTTGKNDIGERTVSWTDAGVIPCWLDYSNGNAEIPTFKGKVQDTTHILLCDWIQWKTLITTTINPNTQDCRVLINGSVYTVLYIDNPMSMNQHLEIYLKYIGGGLDAR